MIEHPSPHSPTLAISNRPKNQMKTTSISRLSAILLLCGFASNCITYTKYQDEPRAKVKFASTRAAQTFYDAYASLDTPTGRGSIDAMIPLYLPYRQTKQDTENKKFNAAFGIADANHDDFLSDREASTYAAKVAEDRKQKWERRTL